LRYLAAKECLRPIPIVRYPNEEEVSAGLDRTRKSAADFVRSFNSRPSPPGVRVLGLHAAFDESGVSAVVPYVTEFLHDEVQLAKETTELLERLLAVKPELCDGNRRIVFRAYGEPPLETSRKYEVFGVVKDCPVRAAEKGRN
jgi:hypothetical protein